VTDPNVPHFFPDRDAGTPRGPQAGLVVLTGADLTVADVEAVARRDAPVALDVHARGRMQEARDVIEALVAEGAVVYGVTTGFGDLATTFIPPAQAGQLQRNLLMSHAAGVGQPFPREVVRAMLLLRANTLALGHSGCRPVLVDAILDLLAHGIHPVVPEQGSVGASGTWHHSPILRCRSSGEARSRSTARSCRLRTRSGMRGWSRSCWRPRKAWPSSTGPR